MEQWKKDQLDNEDPGDVALMLFKKQQEVSRAASWRAEMATAMNIARAELEKREKAYSEASQDERWVNDEYNELAKYLKGRVGDE